VRDWKMGDGDGSRLGCVRGRAWDWAVGAGGGTREYGSPGLDHASDGCGLRGWGGRGSPARLAGVGEGESGAVVKRGGRPPSLLKE
jgi:hypothetical protein